MQTLAASVASMAGMAVLIQAMHWLGFSIDNVWMLIFYFLCIGMFGVGVGMLYTPILVDKMQLTYPSGFAVANILRALTDKALLKVSIGKLAIGTGLGIASGALGEFVPFFGKLHISGATFGAGMVVGVRIALPAIFIGFLGDYVFLPMMQDAGWLGPNDAFRKLGFVVALGAILGAAIVDISLVLKDFAGQLKASKTQEGAQEDWKKVKVGRLILMGNNPVLLVDQTDAVEIQHWKEARALEVIASKDKVEAERLEKAIAANTLSEQDQATLKEAMSTAETEIGRWQSAMTYKLVGAIDVFIGRPVEAGQDDVLTGAEKNAIDKAQADLSKVLVAPPADLSTIAAQKGWAAQLIEAKRAKDKDIQITLLCIGVAFGFVVELLRKLLRKSAAWQRFKTGSKAGATTEFILDVTVLASPYASSFGAFVGFATSAWFSAGGVYGTLSEKLSAKKAKTQANSDIPEDMSTNSLVGGGLIAGESLFYLGIGIVSMILAFAG